MGVLTHLDTFKNSKTLQRTKKNLKQRFWTEVYQGAKLFYLWPGDVDRKAAFALSDAQAMNPEKGGIHLLTQFDPFREQSPEMEAMLRLKEAMLRLKERDTRQRVVVTDQ